MLLSKLGPQMGNQVPYRVAKLASFTCILVFHNYYSSLHFCVTWLEIIFTTGSLSSDTVCT
jgi:hypothetical protein